MPLSDLPGANIVSDRGTYFAASAGMIAALFCVAADFHPKGWAGVPYLSPSDWPRHFLGDVPSGIRYVHIATWSPGLVAVIRTGLEAAFSRSMLRRPGSPPGRLPSDRGVPLEGLVYLGCEVSQYGPGLPISRYAVLGRAEVTRASANPLAPYMTLGELDDARMAVLVEVLSTSGACEQLPPSPWPKSVAPEPEAWKPLA
ncbi:MAG: hypothetical protein ABJB33_01230 [Gemmatimonadota bacterium]